jgi:hypothetical protein
VATTHAKGCSKKDLESKPLKNLPTHATYLGEEHTGPKIQSCNSEQRIVTEMTTTFSIKLRYAFLRESSLSDYSWGVLQNRARHDRFRDSPSLGRINLH